MRLGLKIIIAAAIIIVIVLVMRAKAPVAPAVAPQVAVLPSAPVVASNAPTVSTVSTVSTTSTAPTESFWPKLGHVYQQHAGVSNFSGDPGTGSFLQGWSHPTALPTLTHPYQRAS